MADNAVIYNKDNISVNNPGKERVVVYAHPGDQINIDFDISLLDAEVLNGDLIIHTIDGGMVVVANYALMVYDGRAPKIADVSGAEYDTDHFYSGIKVTYSADNPDSYVIDHRVSTPDSSGQDAEYLATSQGRKIEDGDLSDLVGILDVEEQNPIFSPQIIVKPFPTLSFYNPTRYKYDVAIPFSYAGRTIYNEEEDDSLPIKVRKVNPKSEPIYGTRIEEKEYGGSLADHEYNAFLGGGDLVGNSESKYQYEPQQISFVDQGAVVYNAYTGNTIVRGVSIYMPDDNAKLDTIILSNVPNSINFLSTSEVAVQDIGGGSVLVTAKTVSSGFDLYFTYNLGTADLQESVDVSVSGFDYKLDKVVEGFSSFTIDLREVDGLSDIMNFSQFNTYTYSTAEDPLFISFGDASDTVYGGDTSHTYSMAAGDDIFYSGDGSEQVALGDGNDKYTYSFGDDSVVAGSGINDLYFSYNAFTDNSVNYFNDPGKFKLQFNNGKVIANNTVTQDTAVFQDFQYIYLENPNLVDSQNKSNTIYINNTDGFSNLSIVSKVGASNTEPDEIIMQSATRFVFNSINPFVTTVKDSSGIFDESKKIEIGNNTAGFDILVGSNEDDEFIGGTQKSYTITFDGAGGDDLADYSKIASPLYFKLDYTSESWSVNTGSSTDILLNIEMLQGSQASDTFEANVEGKSMTYHGGSEVADTNDTVDYSGTSTSKGIVVDFKDYSTNNLITVAKQSGIVDNLQYIEKVIVSNNNDTFVIYDDTNYSNVFDGLGGLDTLDYTNANNDLTITVDNVSNDGAQGSVNRSVMNDSFNHIESIKGGVGANDFIINGSQNRDMLYAGGTAKTDSINYSAINSSYHLELDVTASNIDIDKVSAGSSYKDTVDNIESFILTDQSDKIVLNLSSIGAISNEFDMGSDSYNPLGSFDINSNAGDVLELKGLLSELSTAQAADIATNIRTLNIDTSGDFTFAIDASVVSTTIEFVYTAPSTKNREIDAVLISESVTYEIAGIDKQKFQTNGGTTIEFYNFNIFDGTARSDTFNVDVLNGNLTFVSNGGGDQLSYSLNTDKNLSINVVFTDHKIDKYNNSVAAPALIGTDIFDADFANIEGGEGDDVFVIDNNSAGVKIDGLGGSDTVDFSDYTGSITNLNTSNYSNIEDYILSMSSDSIFVTSTTNNESISGGEGFDVVYIADSITNDVDITLQKGSSIAEFEITQDGKTNTYGKFEELNAEGNTKAISYNVNIAYDDNSDYDDSAVYFRFNSAATVNVDYSTLGSAVNLFYGFNDTGNNLYGDKLYVEKQSGSYDYFNYANQVSLTNNKDTIKINLADLSDIPNIDARGGEDTLDVSAYNISAYYDMDVNTINGVAITVANWEVLVTGASDDTLILASSISGDLEIDLGGSYSDMVSFANITTVDAGTITINSGDEVSFAIGGNNIVVKHAEVFDLGGNISNTTIFSNQAGIYTIKSAGSGNIIDYSSITANNIVVNIGDTVNNNSIRVTKDLNTGDYDYIESGFGTIIATSNDDIFTINLDVVDLSALDLIDGAGGTDSLYLESTGATQDIKFTLPASGAGSLEINGMSVGIQSIEKFSSGDGDDVFTIESDSVLNGGYISAGGQTTEDILDIDLQSTGSSLDLVYDVRLSRIYDKTASPADYVFIDGFEKVNLGDGNDVLIISGGSSSGVAIDGGAGDDKISLEASSSPVSGTYDDILASQSVTATNFEGLTLTRYIDNLVVEDANSELIIDGYLGFDIADYSAVTTSLSLQFTSDTSVAIDRGVTTDNLDNFNHYKLGTGDSTISMDQDGNFIFDASASGTTASATIDYTSYNDTRLTIDLYNQKVTKTGDISSTPAFVGTDTIIGFNEIIGTTESDIFLLNSAYLSSNSSYTITVSGGDVLNFARETSGITLKQDASSNKLTADMSGATFVEMLYTNNTDIDIIILTEQDDTYILGTKLLDGVTVDLAGGSSNAVDFSNVSAGATGVTFDVTANEATDGSGNKQTILSANSYIFSGNDDTIEGLTDTQSYTFDGGGGDDTVSYSNANNAITLLVSSPASGSVADYDIQKASGIDTLVKIEKLALTNRDDTVYFDINLLSNSSTIIYDVDTAGGFQDIVYFNNDGSNTIATTDLMLNVDDTFVQHIHNAEVYRLGKGDDTVTFDYKVVSSGTSDLANATFAADDGADEFSLIDSTASALLASESIRLDLNGSVGNTAGFDTAMLFIGSDVGLSLQDFEKFTLNSVPFSNNIKITINDYNGSFDLNDSLQYYSSSINNKADFIFNDVSASVTRLVFTGNYGESLQFADSSKPLTNFLEAEHMSSLTLSQKSNKLDMVEYGWGDTSATLTEDFEVNLNVEISKLQVSIDSFDLAGSIYFSQIGLKIPGDSSGNYGTIINIEDFSTTDIVFTNDSSGITGPVSFVVDSRTSLNFFSSLDVKVSSGATTTVGITMDFADYTASHGQWEFTKSTSGSGFDVVLYDDTSNINVATTLHYYSDTFSNYDVTNQDKLLITSSSADTLLFKVTADDFVSMLVGADVNVMIDGDAGDDQVLFDSDVGIGLSATNSIIIEENQIIFTDSSNSFNLYLANIEVLNLMNEKFEASSTVTINYDAQYADKFEEIKLYQADITSPSTDIYRAELVHSGLTSGDANTLIIEFDEEGGSVVNPLATIKIDGNVNSGVKNYIQTINAVDDYLQFNAINTTNLDLITAFHTGKSQDTWNLAGNNSATLYNNSTQVGYMYFDLLGSDTTANGSGKDVVNLASWSIPASNNTSKDGIFDFSMAFASDASNDNANIIFSRDHDIDKTWDNLLAINLYNQNVQYNDADNTLTIYLPNAKNIISSFADLKDIQNLHVTINGGVNITEDSFTTVALVNSTGTADVSLTESHSYQLFPFVGSSSGFPAEVPNATFISEDALNIKFNATTFLLPDSAGTKLSVFQDLTDPNFGRTALSNDIYVYMNVDNSITGSSSADINTWAFNERTTSTLSIDTDPLYNDEFFYSFASWENQFLFADHWAAELEHTRTADVASAGDFQSLYDFYDDSDYFSNGLVMTQTKDMHNVGTTEGDASDMFMRFQGVGVLEGGEGINDTFSFGRAYQDMSSSVVFSAFYNDNKPSQLQSIDFRGGFDTLFMEYVTGDHTAVNGDVQLAIAVSGMVAGNSDGSTDATPGTTDVTVTNNVRDQKGYFGFYWQLDTHGIGANKHPKLSLIDNAVIDSSNWDNAITAMVDVVNNTTFLESIIINDYSENPISTANTSLYSGVHDDLQLDFFKVRIDDKNSYYEFDLGGRVLEDVATKAYNHQGVSYRFAGIGQPDAVSTIQFYQSDTDTKNPASFIFVASTNGGAQYNVTKVDNADNIFIAANDNSTGDHKYIRIAFVQDIDFDKVDGMTFELHTAHSVPVSFLFKVDDYNYDVNVSTGGAGNTGSPHVITITEDSGSGKFFTIELYGSASFTEKSNTYDLNNVLNDDESVFIKNADDTQFGSKIIHNDQELEELKNDSTDDHQLDDEDIEDIVDDINNESDHAFSDGEDGISSVRSMKPDGTHDNDDHTTGTLDDSNSSWEHLLQNIDDIKEQVSDYMSEHQLQLSDNQQDYLQDMLTSADNFDDFMHGVLDAISDQLNDNMTDNQQVNNDEPEGIIDQLHDTLNTNDIYHAVKESTQTDESHSMAYALDNSFNISNASDTDVVNSHHDDKKHKHNGGFSSM